MSMMSLADEYKAAAARGPENYNELWKVAERGIAKLKDLSAGDPEPPFTADDYMALFTTVYDLVKTSDHCLQVYNNYRLSFEHHLSSTVLPSLQQNHGELLLGDFVNRWSNHKRMAGLMSRIFLHLERYYIPKMMLPGLNEVAFVCFKDMVYSQVKERIRDAALFLIDRVRDGYQVDGALLKNVVDIFIEIGNYADDFEAPLLERASAYYSQKSTEFALQTDECLNVEKYRVSPYLHSSSEAKLLDRVRQELLVMYTSQLQLQDRDEMQL